MLRFKIATKTFCPWMVAALLIAFILPSSASPQYVHKKIISLNAHVNYGYVNSSGIAAFTAQDNVTFHTAAYLGERNYSESMVGVDGNASARGINDSGQLLWNGATVGFVGYIYRDMTNISLPAGAIVGVAAAINGSGQVAWSGLLGSGGWDVFVDQECVSARLAPPKSQNAHAADMNDLGHVLWNTGGNAQVPGGVYLDTTMVSALVSGVGTCAGIAVNNHDQVAWYGSVDNRCDVFRDGENISASILGFYRSAMPRGINDLGQVLWDGYGTTTDNYQHVFLDDVDISAPVIGVHADARAIGLTADGHVLWSGQNTATRREDVFVDSFNITLDALGELDTTVYGLNISKAGHVLWTSYDPNTNLTDVWVSTSVPEPASIVGVICGLMGAVGIRLVRLFR